MRGDGTSGAILDCNDVVDLDSDCEVTPQGNKEVSNSTLLCDGTQSTRCYDAVLSNGVVPPPFVGMIFASWGDIDTYFRNYGRQQGFGILRASGVALMGKRVVAEREGPAKRKSKKCDCLVYMYCCKMKSGDWVVKGLELQHRNHVPTPRKYRYIAMYRKEDINDVVRRKLFTDVVADCIVIDTLRQLDINVEATVNTAGLSGITPTKKTPPKSTKKSPASSRKKTPKSVNKGKGTVTETGKQSTMDVSPTCFEIGSPSTDLLVNDPVSQKSKKRTPKRSNSVKKTALHPQVNSDEVLRLSAGGIEMLTENGSVGREIGCTSRIKFHPKAVCYLQPCMSTTVESDINKTSYFENDFLRLNEASTPNEYIRNEILASTPIQTAYGGGNPGRVMRTPTGDIVPAHVPLREDFLAG
uniref:FAR1 domain-containing protein n=1 Tax=Chenopodium quinoa TaxID=63459 RepID=A0A803LLI5_CHEQI